MPYAFFLGIIMALMLEATDSIITTMIMHFSLNGFTTVLSFFYRPERRVHPGWRKFQGDSFRDLQGDIGSQDFSGLSPEEIDAMAENMLPMALGIVIGILAVIAIAALAAVLALIYATSPNQTAAVRERFFWQNMWKTIMSRVFTEKCEKTLCWICL